ncbi:MAG: Peptidoglycan-N-acetylmuramic acid deacetylase PdaC, partial [Candidatus Parcubacteria bacterium]
DNIEKPVSLVPLVKTDKKIAREEERVSIDVDYPQFANVPPAINSDIKKFAESEIENIDSLKLAEIPTSSNATYFLKINYEIEQSNTDYLSLVFTVNLYTGGAHPNEYFKTFNYDVRTGAPILLAGLYPENATVLEILKPKIAKAVRDSLVDTLRINGDNTSNPDELLFEPIASLDPELFENFTFGSEYITFYFSPYDIAPYAAGPIVAKIER